MAVREDDRPDRGRYQCLPSRLCGAPANPYGYNYCGRGTLIRAPKPDVCDYFRCINNFWNGTG